MNHIIFVPMIGEIDEGICEDKGVSSVAWLWDMIDARDVKPRKPIAIRGAPGSTKQV